MLRRLKLADQFSYLVTLLDKKTYFSDDKRRARGESGLHPVTWARGIANTVLTVLYAPWPNVGFPWGSCVGPSLRRWESLDQSLGADESRAGERFGQDVGDVVLGRALRGDDGAAFLCLADEGVVDETAGSNDRAGTKALRFLVGLGLGCGRVRVRRKRP